MENIIKSAVECGSVYGMVCVLASFIFFYATIRFVMPYIYKIVYKICNTLVKYKDVHTKANIKDISFETELHRQFWTTRFHFGSPFVYLNILRFFHTARRNPCIILFLLYKIQLLLRNRKAASLFWFIPSHGQVFLLGLEYLLQAFRLRIVYTL